MTPPPLLQVRNARKSYGGVHALRSVDLDIHPSSIHALCGENGAGKSTLIKLLCGAESPDAGSFTLDSTPLPTGSVHAAESVGVAVIHQEPALFPDLPAPDNLFLGHEPRRFRFLLDRRAMLNDSAALLQSLGESIDLTRPVGSLSLAQRQMIAIARAIRRRCKLLILDEPTASLSARETAALFTILRRLQSQSVAILYVTHRLEEVFQLADTATVLRDGALIATSPVTQLTRDSLIRHMVGRHHPTPQDAPQDIPPDTPITSSAPPVILQLHNLSRPPLFRDISLAIGAGEILGMAGLIGAGRSELARAAAGIDPYHSGSVTLDSQPLPPRNFPLAVRRGLAMIPEDRHRQGLIAPLSIRDNLALSSLAHLTRFGITRRSDVAALAARSIDQLRIVAPSPLHPVSTLSGGNQQKVLLGRWLARNPRLLILDEPTRGVDVAAKTQIHSLIRRLAARGAAVWLISSDIPELLALSHRILVMRSGSISGDLPAASASAEQLLHLALPDSPDREATHV